MTECRHTAAQGTLGLQATWALVTGSIQLSPVMTDEAGRIDVVNPP